MKRKIAKRPAGQTVSEAHASGTLAVPRVVRAAGGTVDPDNGVYSHDSLTGHGFFWLPPESAHLTPDTGVMDTRPPSLSPSATKPSSGSRRK